MRKRLNHRGRLEQYYYRATRMHSADYVVQDVLLLVPWLSGRTRVFDRRAVAVLRSTYWWVTTYVSKPSAVRQLIKPTQPFILSGSIMSSKLQPDVVTTVRGGAIWWTRTKAKGRHIVVCRLKCVIHVWALWGRYDYHLRRNIDICTFTFFVCPSHETRKQLYISLSGSQSRF